MINFTITKNSTAAPEAVFDRLTDHRGMADVTPLRKSSLEQEGTPAPNGVGAIRRLELVGPAVREEVIEYERPTGFAYKLLSGLPAKDHVGRVTLRETPGGGTEVVYQVTSTPTVPGGKLVLGPILKKSVGDLLKGAIKAAERQT